jgi:8-oxo-dGTP pyrophosphatase MutT (NUDIX family)
MQKCTNAGASCAFLHWCIPAFMHYVNVIARLERSLKSPLPGSAAHDLLSPQPRRQWPEGFHPSRVRDAAALLLVFPVADRAHVVLTVRAGTLERHGGQVSLPGGVVDPGETFDQAALREAHEEVALPLEGVRVLGGLTPLDIPISGFRLHPILAAADERQPLKPAAGEVAAILEVAVEDLLNPAHRRSTDRERDGRRLMIPAFFVAGHEIWGATAMVLAEFLALLGWPSDF